MKKTVLFGLALVAALGFTACDKPAASAETTKVKGGDKEILYSGILPSADALANVYTLKLDYDDDHNYTDGDFIMVENSLLDTVGANPLKEVATSYTEGDFRKESKVVDGVNVEYIRLIPDAKDALGIPSGCSMYFIVNEDGSLTMVSADLQKAVDPEMNYTLTVK